MTTEKNELVNYDEYIRVINQRDSALADLAKTRDTLNEVTRSNTAYLSTFATLRTDLADARDTLLALQRENEALRKTVAQREEVLRDVASKVREFGRE